MIKFILYLDNYLLLFKIDWMRDGFIEFDIEDLDKIFYKILFYVNF